MRKFLMIILLIIIKDSVFAQNIIPDFIKGELTLKPSAKPYETSGFTVEAGATLTILPGTKIKTLVGKDKYCRIEVKGTIIIGDKGPAKCKPVVIEGYSPWVKFEGAKIEINSLDITLVNCQFVGNNSGTIRNSNFYRDLAAIPYPFIVQVPSKDNLTITDCLIEDQGIEIKPLSFPDDIKNLSINKCAFTYAINQNKDSFFYKKCSVNIYVFVYGTKCDSYVDITFSAFDWKLKDAVSSDWFVSNPDFRKTIENATKPINNYTLKLETNAMTSFKQAPEPPKEKPKKDKK